VSKYGRRALSDITDIDIKLMNEAIEWAGGCKPIKESIPKSVLLSALATK
jgi:hypothetical protein